MLSTFGECQKKYELSYKKGLRSRKYKSGLWFGIFFHATLDGTHEKEWAECVLRFPDDKIQITHDMTVAKVAAEQHKKFWKSHPLKIEKTEVVLTTKFNGMDFKAKVDAIGTIDGHHVLVERKTTGLTLDQAKESYTSGPQGKRYLLAMRNHGFNTNTIIWDLVLRPKIRLKQRETHEDFIARCCQEYENDPAKYFHRFGQDISDETLKEFLKDQNHEIADFARTEYFRKNLESCVGKYGKCDFYDLCQGQKSESDYDIAEWMRG